jgi:hypothetical protein
MLLSPPGKECGVRLGRSSNWKRRERPVFFPVQDLFTDAEMETQTAVAAAPLASRIRPRSLEEFVGQKHILAPGKLLRRAIEADRLPSVILSGPPGTGKSTLACQFPGAYVVDMDVNLEGPLRYLRKRNMRLPLGYDRLDIDDNGAPVPLVSRYLRLETCFNKVQLLPEVQTIVLDSATGFTDILMAETLRRQPDANNNKNTYQRWGFFYEYGKHFLTKLGQMRKHIVFVAHERPEKDEFDGTVKYRVSWPGRLGENIGIFFTDVWRCEVSSSGGLEPKHKWLVRTMPDHKYDLKNGFEFKPLFEFTWDQVAQRLQEEA